MEHKEETISAFAFHTGKEIERIINETTDNLKEENMLLEAKILSFRHKILKTQERYSSTDIFPGLLSGYDSHFSIKSQTEGKV